MLKKRFRNSIKSEENGSNKKGQSNGIRNSTEEKHIIVIDSDLLKYFPDESSVNSALHSLIEEQVKKLDKTPFAIGDYYIQYCQKQKDTQRKAITMFKWSFMGLFIGGLVIFFLTLFIDFKNDIISDITKYVGPLTSVVSTLPFIQIISRRERYNKYEWLVEGLEKERNNRSEEYLELVKIVKDDIRKV